MQEMIRCFIALSMAMIITHVYAETNNPSEKIPPTTMSLYQQPDSKSPVVGSVPSNQAIMPIFTQGEWTKIADPSNGNVGWVSNEILKQQNMPYVKTITQSINAPNQMGYNAIQYFGTPMDDKQITEMMKKWQAQRNDIQNVFGQVLQQNIKALDALAKQFQDPDFQFPMVIPVLQPVVIMPNKAVDKMVVPATTKAGDTKKD